VTLPEQPEDYVHRIGRVGRADYVGLAISLVSRHPEKVWWHTCPSRGKKCNNTTLVEDGGCAKWFDEAAALKVAYSNTCYYVMIFQSVEERIHQSIPSVGADYKLPVTPVQYGTTRAMQGKNYCG